MARNRLTEQLAQSGVEQQKEVSPIPNFVKSVFASMETSGDTAGDWLQLEEGTFNYLKDRGRIPSNVNFKDLGNPLVYDKVALAYIMDLKNTFKIPTLKEAALWSWRPGWYRKYDGNIEAIPESVKGVAGKSARRVMQDRLRNLQQAGF